MGDCDAAELAQGLEVIERNVHAQHRIIEDLLDMNRILSGKVRLDVQRVNLAEVIEAALETVRPAANAKKIRVTAVLDPLAKPVSGDPQRLQQVFWNLLKNAVKFTPAGGMITIRSRNDEAGQVIVEITDTGIGLTEDAMQRLFLPFEQAGLANDHRFGGLWLGLSISKALVELHQGTIAAESPGTGKGATFRVTLPTVAAEPE
eukprot:gene14355-17537_t